MSANVYGRLGGWLARTRPDWRNIHVIPKDVQIGSGFSAEIFSIDVTFEDGEGPHCRTLVVRRQPRKFEVVFGSDLTLQANMMAALDARGDVPVPPWIGIETDPELLGDPFLVMGCVEGRAATQRPNYNVGGWLTELSPANRHDRFAGAFRALAKVHAIDWEDGFSFLDRPGHSEPGLDQYVGNLVEWHAHAKQGRDTPILDAALAYVLANKPANAEACVLWGDPSPANTMWRDDGSVAALIDWELAALGPPELDLAWWLYYDDLFSRRFGIARLDGLPTRDESIAIYEQASGRRLANMEYYDLVVALRTALIAVGAFDRQVSLGNISAENRSLDNNFMTMIIAEKLGLPAPELGDDFRDFMRNLVPVDS